MRNAECGIEAEVGVARSSARMMRVLSFAVAKPAHFSGSFLAPMRKLSEVEGAAKQQAVIHFDLNPIQPLKDRTLE